MLVAYLLLLFIFIPKKAHSEQLDTPATPPTFPAIADKPRTIARYAAQYGADYSIAVAIARCESQLNPNARNSGSSAKGLYQFLDGTWAHYGKMHWGSLEGKSVLDYGDNAELGVWVIATYGTADWDASKYCWN